jgi:D-serine deaminase-like pyridoxal phosphate-dependent protein
MKSIPEHLRATIGQRVDLIDTPALVLDLDAMERNIQRMADFARKHQVRWRPHAKMHKSAEIALLLEKAGAHGHCVQKVAEAEALAAAGVDDLYISNEVLAAGKLLRAARLAAQLAARGGRLAIAVDSEEGVARLAEAMRVAGSDTGIDVFVEIDVGQGRCGVPPGPEAVTLAQAVAAQPRLHFAGLQAYHGRAQHLRTATERRDAITGSGTGTLVHEAASGVYGELQAGSFLYMDADYAANEREPAQPAFEHALFVKTQVISARATHAVCDAGHKSHAVDSGLPTVHGLPPERALRYASCSDEHGVLTAEGSKARLPALGRMLWLVPGHCDPTVNLHDYLIGVRGGLAHGVVDRIIRVDARGALT